MNAEDHRRRHLELHHALDELLADWIGHNVHADSDKTLSNTSILELMAWSHRQTIQPDELPVTEDKC